MTVRVVRSAVRDVKVIEQLQRDRMHFAARVTASTKATELAAAGVVDQ